MKVWSWIVFVLVCLFFWGPVFAQQDVTEIPEVVTLVNGIVPVLMMVAVSIFKRLVPMIPRALLPFLPTVVAPLLLQLANMVAGTVLASPLLTAQMGTIAIGMREMANWLVRGIGEKMNGGLETFEAGQRRSGFKI